MANPVWALIEYKEGKPSPAGLEAIAAARTLAGALSTEAHGVVLGSGVQAVAEEAAGHGLAKVWLAENEKLAEYTTHGWVGVLARLVEEHSPSVVVASHGAIGRDLAGRLAARVGGAALTDCLSVTVDGETLVAERPNYAGKLVSTVEAPAGAVRVVTLRPKAFDKAEKGGDAGTVESVSVEVQDADLKEIVKETVAKASGRPGLTEADIVVSAGRGIKGPENFGIIEELADTLGAAVGASRAVVDAGWREHSAQVGQTGVVVTPKLYIACGISGAIQHLVGMQDSQYILAINKDPEAPIFGKADFGIVGDLFEVVPELKKAFAEALAH